MRLHGARGGFTLVECMLAGSILAFLSLVLFEGVVVASRIARENSEVMQAEAVAWDAVWKRFNEEYSRLVTTGEPTGETLLEEAAPELARYDQPPEVFVKVENAKDAGGVVLTGLKSIEAWVEWGPVGRRKSTADVQRIFVYRGELGRVCDYQ